MLRLKGYCSVKLEANSGEAHEVEPVLEYIDVCVDGKRGCFDRSKRKTVFID